uniref:Glucose-methanol-choline oxidoreductase N-terminal domain-containing protein n=1 Tax=Lygus hesperus TaxID=30085 RepID=A0A0K8S3Y4_LYGHE
MIFLGLIQFLLAFDAATSQMAIVDRLLNVYAKMGFTYREERFLDNLPILDSYDFVIVGAGPGGAVTANRLSENPKWTVLLLEAGIEGNLYTDIPALNIIFGFTNYNWKYVTESQPELMCRGMTNKRCSWPSGKGVGGTTIWNGLMWTRCPASDFDEWEAMGNPGWGYQSMLKNFLKVENVSIPELRDSPYHSTTGPVGVQYPFRTQISDVFMNAGREFGYDWVDYNNPKTPTGFSRTQISARNGRRVDAATAYLLPIKNRQNLHVLKNAFVNRVIIDENTKTATGVEFVKNENTRVVSAKKEVILSAGTFNTPKLLMLSGIGPAEHLKSNGIKVIQDSPAVGQNLQEHISPLTVVTINSSISYNIRKLAPIIMPAFREWVSNGGGILSSNVAEVIGYVKTDPSLSKPDIEMIFSPVSIAADDGILLRRYFGISEETYETTFAPINQRESFTICPLGMYPKSKGEIRLNSSNPVDPPVIITNFLKEPEDVKNMVDAQKLVQKILETESMKKIGARLYDKPVLGCEEFEFGTDEYFECSVRTITMQFHHQCCTARMGPNPEDSVVSPRLRVHGVKNLRVVDASVMPKIPGAHTMSVTYAIAENAADIIKEDWNNEL